MQALWQTLGEMLIKNVELLHKNSGLFDVFAKNGKVASVHPAGSHPHSYYLNSDSDFEPDEAGASEVIDAEGSALIPGLYDHHIHLLALLESFNSLDLSQPSNHPSSLEDLERILKHTIKNKPKKGGPGEAPNIRAIGYHESMAGNLNRQILDTIFREKPLRIQHRSGALWILNTPALKELTAELPADFSSTFSPKDLEDGLLYRADRVLIKEEARKDFCPNLGLVAAHLNDYGVTGVTDATPGYSKTDVAIFKRALMVGDFTCKLMLMADDYDAEDAGWMGPRKIILDDFAADGQEPLSFEDLCEIIFAAHEKERAVAIHSVTRTTLALVVAALNEVGPLDGDRIEHAGVAPPQLTSALSDLNVRIVTQPNFITERGDNYIEDVPADDQRWLYRCQGWLDAGVRLAAGTDAPFGNPNPWLAIYAAVNRRTPSGQIIGIDESLDFTSALELFLSPGDDPGGKSRHIEPGTPADLCLLSAPLAKIAKTQPENPTAKTFLNGRLVSSSIIR